DVIGNKTYEKSFAEKYAEINFYVKKGIIDVYKCNIDEIKDYKILTFNKHTFINNKKKPE
ncbi:hypothetical protein, partial [Corallincola luteus]|uniref:hypothetical protein n=1 Tax=Corallincola luteus TaxID=1775177 RepID=UPI00196A973E